MFNSKGFGQGGFGGNDSMSVGGGFLTSPSKSPMTSTQGDKKRVIQNMMPVTVAQLLKIPDGEDQLKVGPLAAHMINLLGKVVAVDEQTTKVTYKIDDMTGPPLEVQLWLGDNDNVNTDSVPIVEGMFVRVMGSVRSVKGQRLVTAFKILPVMDYNEITTHMLEVIHTHMSLAVMEKQPAEEKMDTSSAFMGGMMSMGGGNGMMPSDNNLGLNKQQNMVYQAIFSVQNEDGISIDVLCNTLKSLPKSTISEHLKFLCNEGHIYTTIDDDHYKTIDSM